MKLWIGCPSFQLRNNSLSLVPRTLLVIKQVARKLLVNHLIITQTRTVSNMHAGVIHPHPLNTQTFLIITRLKTPPILLCPPPRPSPRPPPLITDDMSFHLMNKLSIGSLNVCGLKRRIHYPEFIEIIQKFDILCLSETKLTDTDVISCDGFTFFNQPRRQKFIRTSEGIGFLAL